MPRPSGSFPGLVCCLLLLVLWPTSRATETQRIPSLAVEEASVSLHSLLVEHAGYHGSFGSDVYTFAVFQVLFSKAVSVTTALGGGQRQQEPGVFDDLSYYPAEADVLEGSLTGITRLICGDKFFESFPPSLDKRPKTQPAVAKNRFGSSSASLEGEAILLETAATNTESALWKSRVYRRLVPHTEMNGYFPHSVLARLSHVYPPSTNKKSVMGRLDAPGHPEGDVYTASLLLSVDRFNATVEELSGEQLVSEGLWHAMPTKIAAIDRVEVLAESAIPSCRLEFTEPGLQAVRPARVLAHGAAVINGSFPLTVVDPSARKSSPDVPYSDKDTETAIHQLRQALANEVTSTLKPSAAPQHNSSSPTPHAQPSGSVDPDFTPFSGGYLAAVEMMTQGSERHLSRGGLATKARVLARERLFDAVDGPVKGIMSGLVKALASMVAESLGDKLTATLASDLGQSVTGGICDHLVMKLVPLTSEDLSTGIQPALIESLAASVLESVPKDLGFFVSKAVSGDLQSRIHPVVTKSVSEIIPNEVIMGAPEVLALNVMRPLVHMLGRTIPHIVAPALSHVMTHSAAMDYICQACSEKGQWCQFCHFATEGTMYAHFYSGYHTTWYTDYYSDYYWNYYAGHLSDFYMDKPANTMLDGKAKAWPRHSDDGSQSITNRILGTADQ